MLNSEYTHYVRGQWEAFDKVLNWINTQEEKIIPKTELYEAVMKMRPKGED